LRDLSYTDCPVVRSHEYSQLCSRSHVLPTAVTARGLEDEGDGAGGVVIGGSLAAFVPAFGGVVTERVGMAGADGLSVSAAASLLRPADCGTDTGLSAGLPGLLSAGEE
jgi:hypothetical protein